jgi:hypothetical protein
LLLSLGTPDCGNGCYDLLGQDVERLFRNRQTVELSFSDGANPCHALHQIISSEWIEDPLRYGTEPVTRATHPLQQNTDRARRTDVAHQIDMADVDAKLQGSRSDNHGELTRFELLFNLEAGFPR